MMAGRAATLSGMVFYFPIAGIAFDFHDLHVVTQDLIVHLVTQQGNPPCVNGNFTALHTTPFISCKFFSRRRWGKTLTGTPPVSMIMPETLSERTLACRS